jgi:hypothetical protein
MCMKSSIPFLPIHSFFFYYKMVFFLKRRLGITFFSFLCIKGYTICIIDINMRCFTEFFFFFWKERKQKFSGGVNF